MKQIIKKALWILGVMILELIGMAGLFILYALTA